jgi:hypothetical protein
MIQLTDYCPKTERDIGLGICQNIADISSVQYIVKGDFFEDF